MRVALLGEIEVLVPRLRIGGPTWRPEVNTLEATDVSLRLRYRDLWEWRRGAKSLRVKELSAHRIEADLRRRADGTATWQIGQPRSQAAAPDTDAAPLLQFDRLVVNEAGLSLDDAPLQLKAHIEAALSDVPAPNRPAGLGLSARAEGRYLGRPLTARLDTGSPLPWLGSADSAPVPMRLRLEAGRAKLQFDGRVRELLSLQGLDGAFLLSGPSLAAVGDPLGLTLPSTAAFEARGRLSQENGRWHADVARVDLGRSRLEGRFDYRDASPRPVLTGRLAGSTLWFGDLAPTIAGAPADGAAESKARPGKLLPNQPFDLPSLRAMDADIEIALQRVELGAAFAAPLMPLQGRLKLQDGVLTLSELDARSARGRIAGQLSLDGREAIALWRARLQWSGLSLEQWLKQSRGPGQPPYVSGLLNGRLSLDGRGRSTAELLASAKGRVQMHLPGGEISHLAVEAAGIDLAESLGMLLRGDDTLPLQCAVADLLVDKGQVVPKVLLVDTRDSTLWVEGRVALDTEKIDLRLQVAPKDFSPLSLRTPLLISGSLAAPTWSLERGPLITRRLLPAVLLAVINPLAGLLPLLDTGEDGAREQQLLRACQRLAPRITEPTPRS